MLCAIIFMTAHNKKTIMSPPTPLASRNLRTEDVRQERLHAIFLNMLANNLQIFRASRVSKSALVGRSQIVRSILSEWEIGRSSTTRFGRALWFGKTAPIKLRRLLGREERRML